MERVMVDIETLGVCPGSAVTEVGVFWFGGPGRGTDFRITLPLAEQVRKGYNVEEDTFQWALKNDGGREALARSIACREPLEKALCEVVKALAPTDRALGAEFWANGPDFDLRILEPLLMEVVEELPWRYWEARCFRTFLAITGTRKPKETAHDALVDARKQAEVVSGWMAAKGVL